MTERAICEGCSVCGKQFEVQLRWQMEERDGGFSFFCSRPCYETSAVGEGAVTCDACSKRFSVELVSQVVALKAHGKSERRYACSLPCREQLVREADGARLGDDPVRMSVPATRPTPAAKMTTPTPTPATDQVPRRIAVFNHKGGTGKTTTAVSVAAALAARGKRVLLVDTDAQGNVAASLGLRTDKAAREVVRDTPS